ncbi:MAG: hypothetical protein ACM3IH_10645 [Sphingobacteriales bacterium]
MADGNSGGVGVLGVLIGALIVIVVGGGILFATGNLGQKSSTVKVELPKNSTTNKAGFTQAIFPASAETVRSTASRDNRSA